MKRFNIDRKLIAILLIVFVNIFGASMVLPVLPLYAQRDFGLSPQAISLLLASYFIGQFFAGPYLGRLSDTRGRLPVLILSQIGTTLSFVMLGIAQSAVLLFAARTLDGITGGNIIVAQAYVTDVTPKERRTEVLGYIFAAFGLGFIFGPALGGVVAAYFGDQAPFWFAAGISLITVLLTWFILDESLPPAQQAANRTVKTTGLAPGEVLKNAPLVLTLIVVFIAQFAMGLLQSTFALFGDAVIFAGYDDRAVNLGIGLLLAIVGLTQFSTQSFLLKPLLKRYSEATLVIAGTILRVAGMALFAIAFVPAIGGLASIIFPLGIGIMMPSLQSITTKTTVDALRGGVLGLYQSSVSLSIIFGTALGGVLFAITPTMPYWTGAVLGVISLIPAGILWKQYSTGSLKGNPE